MVNIFLDLEMIPIPKDVQVDRDICRNEVIQIGAVALNKHLDFVGEYTQIVKPYYSENITPVIYRLTGITTEVLRKGISFREALITFSTWCDTMADEEGYEIYAWSNSDLIQLQQEMIVKELTEFLDMKFMNVWKDFQYEFSELVGISSIMSLDKAIKALDIDFVGSQHDALNDAKNTAKLYQLVQNKVELEKAMKPIKKMMEPSKQLSTSMGSIFNLDMFDFGKETND